MSIMDDIEEIVQRCEYGAYLNDPDSRPISFEAWKQAVRPVPTNPATPRKQ